MKVKVEVRFFASLADRAGTSSESVEIDPSADVAGLWAVLATKHPAFAEIPYRPMVACDMTYAGWDRKLQGVREVAFLPPVSGG